MKILILFILLIVLGSEKSATGFTMPVKNTQSTSTLYRYVIYRSSLIKGKRYLILIAEEKAFSKEGFVEIVRLIKKRYNRSEKIQVSMVSSLRQLRTPEEDDVLPHSEDESELPHLYNPFAVFSISTTGTEIKYQVKIGERTEWKILLLDEESNPK